MIGFICFQLFCLVYSASANVAFVKILNHNISEKRIRGDFKIYQIADWGKKWQDFHGIRRGWEVVENTGTACSFLNEHAESGKQMVLF